MSQNDDLTIDQLDTHRNSRHKTHKLLTLLNRVLLSDDKKIAKMLEEKQKNCYSTFNQKNHYFKK